MDEPAQDTGQGTLTTFGQLLTPPERLLTVLRRAATAADLKPLLELEDNFVAVYTSGRHVWIVNSLYSLTAYFYALTPTGFAHGDTVHAVARSADVDLSWNHEAIADLMALGHLVSDETLARGVRSVPQGAVLHWDGERLETRRFQHGELAAPADGRDLSERLIELFLDGLRAGAGGRPVTTASSGLDSRVNLAGLLHLGLRPELLVMGDPASKDVAIVKEMGRAFDLRVNHVPLELSDYLDAAGEIARVTNGVKPFDHWHTHVFARRSGYGRGDQVVTGNNGEHVRAVGFDYGALALGLDGLSRHDGHRITDHLLARYWGMKTHVILRPEEIRACGPEFAAYYGTSRQNQKWMGVMPPDRSFVWQSDAFVLEQRRRVFQACGLKLMSLHFSPFSPYMRKGWIDAAWSLPLAWRLGSRWHRHAVERLCPRLLDFPEEKEASRMLRRQRPLAWVPRLNKIYRRPRPIPYMDYDPLLRRREVAALLGDHAAELEDFMPKRLVESIVDEQLRSGGRRQLFVTLTGMAVWRASMRGARPTA
jgi:asparagine synthase (glutamine-hydrolysing)